MDIDRCLSRRSFLGGIAAGMAGLALGACTRGNHGTTGGSVVPILSAGARPFPTLPEGTDMIPEIEHIVVLMLGLAVVSVRWAVRRDRAAREARREHLRPEEHRASSGERP